MTHWTFPTAHPASTSTELSQRPAQISFMALHFKVQNMAQRLSTMRPLLGKPSLSICLLLKFLPGLRIYLVAPQHDLGQFWSLCLTHALSTASNMLPPAPPHPKQPQSLPSTHTIYPSSPTWPLLILQDSAQVPHLPPLKIFPVHKTTP